MKKLWQGWGKFKKDNKGFTLMEMMIVVAIIAILSAIAIPKFSNSMAVANTAKVKADLQTINTAGSLYYNQKGAYATSINDLEEFLEVGKLSKPSGKVMVNGEATDIDKGAEYKYNAGTGATFMGKGSEEFSSSKKE